MEHQVQRLGAGLEATHLDDLVLQRAQDRRGQDDVARLVHAVHVAEGGRDQVAGALGEAELGDHGLDVLGGGEQVGVVAGLDAVLLAADGTDLDLHDRVGGDRHVEQLVGDVDVAAELDRRAVPHVRVEQRLLAGLDALGAEHQQRTHVLVQVVLGAVVGVQGDVHRVLVGDRVRELGEGHGPGDHVLGVLAGRELRAAGRELHDAVALSFGEAAHGGDDRLRRGAVHGRVGESRLPWPCPASPRRPHVTRWALKGSSSFDSTTRPAVHDSHPDITPQPTRGGADRPVDVPLVFTTGREPVVRPDGCPPVGHRAARCRRGGRRRVIAGRSGQDVPVTTSHDPSNVPPGTALRRPARVAAPCRQPSRPPWRGPGAGGIAVITDPDVLAGHCVDWTGRWTGPALGAVRPTTTEQVAAVLVAARSAGVAVQVQGGNTGLVGGSVPDRPALLLLTTGLDASAPGGRRRADGRVGAGVTAARLAGHARAAGLHFGVDLAARDSATVGGMVATNAGGMGVWPTG